MQLVNATIVTVPKTREEIADLSIRMFERLKGRKATEEEVRRVRERAWENVPE